MHVLSCTSLPPNSIPQAKATPYTSATPRKHEKPATNIAAYTSRHTPSNSTLSLSYPAVPPLSPLHPQATSLHNNHASIAPQQNHPHKHPRLF